LQAQKMLLSNHFSSREGGRIHLLVLHTTEGSGSLADLKRIFEGEEASSHYGSDAEGRIAQYVQDQFKAWTQCNYNPVALSLEQIAFASFTRTHWFHERHEQLEAAAKFLVYGHVHYGVPIRQGEIANGGIVREGVVQHKDLGIIGCGHSDCGDGYPQKYVMLLARYYIAHKLHEDAPITRRLKREVNAIRQHYGVDPIR
jgi:N-acetylmuramoyl-L-alanine amidase